MCADLILGQDFLKLHEFTTFDRGGNRDPIIIGSVNNVCGVAAARVDPTRIFQFLNEKIHPIVAPSRRYNEVNLEFIKSEVQKLLSEGIIEPSESPWRAQVLMIKSESHKRRMVVDYSETINRFTDLAAYPLPCIDEQVDRLAKCKLFSTLDLQCAYHQIPLAEIDRIYTAF